MKKADSFKRIHLSAIALYHIFFFLSSAILCAFCAIFVPRRLYFGFHRAFLIDDDRSNHVYLLLYRIRQYKPYGPYCPFILRIFQSEMPARRDSILLSPVYHFLWDLFAVLMFPYIGKRATQENALLLRAAVR